LNELSGDGDSSMKFATKQRYFSGVAPRPDNSGTAVNRATIGLIQRSGLPFKTITWDNGTEFHCYRQIEQATGVRCFFAYPHHPWERGSNENFNGLIRQYFRKGKSLSGKRQSDCDQVVAKLNSRPRKRHGFQTPIQRIQQLSGVLHLGC
jgi:IS30 family transposase